MELLLSREFMIVLAVLGGAASVLATSMHAGGASGQRARYLHWAGYGFMGASMLLFVVLGIRGA